MHKPSGLGIYGMWQHEEVDGGVFLQISSGLRWYMMARSSDRTPDTDVWYVKPFWRKAWSPIWRRRVLYGEFGQYKDQFGCGWLVVELRPTNSPAV